MEASMVIDTTLRQTFEYHPKQFVVGQAETIVGHVANVRDLGKLAFFTLRSQTWDLQVVCAVKSLIHELRSIDEYSLVEVAGIIREKHRRCARDTPEHELHATLLKRVGRNPDDWATPMGETSAAREIFKRTELVVQGARLKEATRKVMRQWGIVELPSPRSIAFIDRQALGALEYARVSVSGTERCCIHPPFHIYSRFLVAGGLHRFGFFSSAIPGRTVLHIVVSQPGSGEMQAICGDLVAAQSSSDSDLLQLKEARIASTARDRDLSFGLGLSENRIFYRNGTAIAYWFLLDQNIAPTESATTTRGATAAVLPAWWRIFRAGGEQPVPKIEMLTLLVDEQFGTRTTVRRRDAAQLTDVLLGPYVDLADGREPGRARVAQIAQAAEAERLLVELEILRGNPEGIMEIACPMALEAALKSIETVLPAYNIPLHLARRLLVICRRIHPEWQVARPTDLFQMLWTLLGSASVRSLLEITEGETDGVGKLITHGIITEKMQLLYVYPTVLTAIDGLLSGGFDDDRSAFIGRLRTLMAQRPTLFSTTLQTLAKNRMNCDKDLKTSIDRVLRCVEMGVATPLLARLTSSVVDDPGQLTLLLGALRRAGETAFPNQPLQLTEVATAFVSAYQCHFHSLPQDANFSVFPELGREILYYLYRPITMDFSMFCDVLTRLSDRTEDWETWGIGAHGEFWNETLGCYEYWIDRGVGRIGTVRLYGSKNIGSFFAKSTAGICTDTNTELFNRPDHYHFNIVDAEDGRAAGNVQLYLGEGGDGRFLLVRGINPIQGFCASESVDELVHCILHAICDMAAFGGFSQVRLSEQNGLWNSDSSRSEVRACLKRICAGKAPRRMERAFHLYDYGGKSVNIDAYYPIWECSSAQSKYQSATGGTSR